MPHVHRPKADAWLLARVVRCWHRVPLRYRGMQRLRRSVPVPSPHPSALLACLRRCWRCCCFWSLSAAGRSGSLPPFTGRHKLPQRCPAHRLQMLGWLVGPVHSFSITAEIPKPSAATIKRFTLQIQMRSERLPLVRTHGCGGSMGGKTQRAAQWRPGRWSCWRVRSGFGLQGMRDQVVIV